MSSNYEADSDFWSQLIPQSRYRKTFDTDEFTEPRPLDLTVADFSKLPSDQQRYFESEVRKIDQVIIAALLDDAHAQAATADRHLDTLLSELGLQ